MQLPILKCIWHPNLIQTQSSDRCVYNHSLNALTEVKSWHLYNTEHVFKRIGAKRAKYFTRGFHQVEIYPLFLCVFHIKRDPFGPKNTPSYFHQPLVYVILASLLYAICEIYVDDLIVYDKDDFIKTSAQYSID